MTRDSCPDLTRSTTTTYIPDPPFSSSPLPSIPKPKRAASAAVVSSLYTAARKPELQKQVIADLEFQVERLQHLLIDLSQERDKLAAENESLHALVRPSQQNIVIHLSPPRPQAADDLPSKEWHRKGASEDECAPAAVQLADVIEVIRELLPSMVVELGEAASPSPASLHVSREWIATRVWEGLTRRLCHSTHPSEPPPLSLGEPQPCPDLPPVSSPCAPADLAPALTGRTFFGRLQDHWRCFSPCAELPLQAFLSACKELAGLYDRLGGFLGAAKQDMLGILTTVSTKTAQLPQLQTVEDAMRYDIEHSLTFDHTKNRKGLSFNILWLSRALRFIVFLLANLSPASPSFGDKEAKDCAKDAYERAIKPFHGFLLSNVFSGMMSRVPARRALMTALSEGQSEGVVYAEMAAFVDLVGPVVESLHNFIVQHELNHPWKA
ncbi:MAG: hypothetical protein SGPRY_009046 [Prymnesium sp.]